jgi:hypothetical protein
MITRLNTSSSGWSSFTSTNGNSGTSSGGSGGSPNSNSSTYSYNSDDTRNRRNYNILSWLDNCFREGEVGTVNANSPLRILVFTTTSTGLFRNQGPSQW